MSYIFVLSIVMSWLCNAGQRTGVAGKPSASANDLDTVLSKMDEAARTFQSGHATLQGEHYQKVTNEREEQAGEIYVRRHDKDKLEVALKIVSPDTGQLLRHIVFRNGKLRMYEP